MRCRSISKEETWINHIEELEPVCERNKTRAKRARDEDAQAKVALVVNQAQAALADRMQCGLGTCSEGSDCVKPSVSDVEVVGDADYKLEATLADPQPEPNPCENNEKQWKVIVSMSFKIKARCKCEEKPKKPPIKYVGEPLNEPTKRSTVKRAAKKPTR